jgi:hypothetical protein
VNKESASRENKRKEGPAWKGKLTAVDSVDDGKCKKQAKVGPRAVDPVHGQRYSSHDAHGVFPAVDEVRKHVARVLVAPDALEESPYRWQSRQEAEKPGVVRVALRRVVPVSGVQTKEEFNILGAVSGKLPC